MVDHSKQAVNYLDDKPREVLERIRIKKAKSSLLGFTQYTNPDYEANWHHEIICKELDDFMRSSDIDRLMVLVAPRRGKSELVSRRFPAYYLGHYPDNSIIATSYGADLASAMNRDVQRIIDSPVYRDVFPDTRLSGKNIRTTSLGNYVRTSDKFEIVGRKGVYRSTGVGGGITGMGGALCLEKNTQVLTQSGYKAISDLRIGEKVWSYNHEKGRVELNEIEGMASRTVSKTVTVKTNCGTEIISTPDHPFFTKERKYQEAQNLRIGERFITTRIPQNTFSLACFKMRPLWYTLRQETCRLRQVFTERLYRLLLLKPLFTTSPQYQEQETVCYLWEENGEQNTKILRRLQNPIHQNSPKEENTTIQKICCNKAFNYVSGWLQMCNVRFKKSFTSTSYRPRQTKQSTNKFTDIMSVLSRNLSSWVRPKTDETEVYSVQENKGRKVKVYDIRVAQNHNFFAEGILVHNCIIDDPLKDMAEALSPTRKRVIYEWYTSTLYTRLAKDGKIIIILTRWAEDDLAGRLLEDAEINDEADKWKVICFPEEYEKDHPYIHPEDPRTEEGQVLWPEWFPEDKLKKTKASVGTKVFTSLYQQRPAPVGGSIVKVSWLGFFKELPKFTKVVLSVDCSFKDSEGSDYVAMILFGLKGADKYIIHLYRARASIIETIAQIKHIHRMFEGTINYTLIEDKANGPAVISMIKNEIAGVIPFNPGRDSKIARFTAVAPQIEAGNLHVPDKYYEPNRERFPWCIKLLDIYLNEMMVFPNGPNDDFVDATSQLFLKENKSGGWLSEMVTKLEIEEKSKTEIKKNKVETLAETFGWDVGRNEEGSFFD